MLSMLALLLLAGAFDDPDIIHVDDTVDPVRDLETISAELRLKVYIFLFSLMSSCDFGFYIVLNE